MSTVVERTRRICLIDGSGYIFRAFHALPPLTRGDGTPTNAVLGFCNMIYKLARDREGDGLAVLFDTARTTFRNEIYQAYKANRPPPPEALIPQFPLIREATRAFGLPAIELPGFEADDLIATYARLASDVGADVTIVSSDKDLMQLVGDGVTMLDPIRMREIGPDQVREKFGVGPDKVIDVQALAGDSTDNVPGVPGNRGEDGSPPDSGLRQSRRPARTRGRDQAAEAAAEPDRSCRDGADQPRSRDLASRCAGDGVRRAFSASRAGARDPGAVSRPERVQVAARPDW